MGYGRLGLLWTTVAKPTTYNSSLAIKVYRRELYTSPRCDMTDELLFLLFSISNPSFDGPLSITYHLRRFFSFLDGPRSSPRGDKNVISRSCAFILQNKPFHLRAISNNPLKLWRLSPNSQSKRWGQSRTVASLFMVNVSHSISMLIAANE